MPGPGNFQFARDMTGRFRHILLMVQRTGWVVLGAWILCGFWQSWWRAGVTLEDLRMRVLLTLIGVQTAVWTAGRLLETHKRFGRTGRVAMVALVLSFLCFVLLIWTNWKTQTWLWRVWWIAAVGTVTAAHIMWLNIASTGSDGPLRRGTMATVLATAACFAWIAIRRDLLADPPVAWLWTIGLLGVFSTIGSLIFWRRMQRWRKARPALGRVPRLAWLGAAVLATFAFGFYLGRVTAPTLGPTEMPSALAGLSRDQLEIQAADDLKRLRIIAGGLDDLSGRLAVMQKELRSRRQLEGRDYFTPDEDNRVRSAFMSYLAYRAALLRMVATYGGYGAVEQEDLKARCFLTGYGAATMLVRNSSRLVADYKDDAIVRRKLNEPEPNWGISAGLFDQIHENIMNERNATLFEEMAEYYKKMRPVWRSAMVLPAEDMDWLTGRIDQAIDDVRSRPFDRSSAAFHRMLKRVRKDAYQPYYATSSMISTWIGDTRMVEREPFVSIEQIRQLQQRLQPGDILLERRNWFFSNAFLPGFWPHSALYIGTIDDLADLGLVRKTPGGGWTSDHPKVLAHLEQYLKLAKDGQPNAVIEAVSEGVIFNSLTHSLHADYVAVLRPRLLTKEQRATAILNAISEEGKPYDFEFDFFSSDKLVCTELIYRAFGKTISLNLVQIMGRRTLPAIEFCRKFATERGAEAAELDFVAFLDTPQGHSIAREATAEEFVASANRPRGFNE